MTSKKLKSVGTLLLIGVIYLINHFTDGSLSGLLGQGGEASGGGTAVLERDPPPANTGGGSTRTEQPSSAERPKKTGSSTRTPDRGSSPAASTENFTDAEAERWLAGEREILAAIRARRSDFVVEAAGVITRSLPDDNEGSRHQKFIVKLPQGQTVLISHNIDLAPRVPLREGDFVVFKGEYEWTERGGVVHWTHHDPKGWHEEGFIRHEGEFYD